jgi:hypothetical protein
MHFAGTKKERETKMATPSSMGGDICDTGKV